ncbi:MAG TPA: SIR2 family protein [Acidimicrobiia bacterium]|nr:SIR2 family protein [Acidimicrobiia bacterium]
MPPFSPGNRVVVLGAGATRGATTSFGKECLPPLNADFFTQMQRLGKAKHLDITRKVIKDVVALFGPNFGLTMEDYFTQLDSIAYIARLAAQSGPAFTSKEIGAKRDRLMQALAAVLEESTDVSRKDAPTCGHHRAIVDALSARDTIISFNYDCVVDHTLRTFAQGKWSAKYGYGFPDPSRIVGSDAWDAASPPAHSTGSIYLLKLHGSLNWQLPTPDEADPAKAQIKLKRRLYQQNGTPRFTIIPPVWGKNIDVDPNLRSLWKNAERAIRQARTLALVGFSFTPTDLHVESLFRIALAKTTRLQTLVIANPSREHRQRIRAVFSKPLAGGTLVRQYEDLASFAAGIGSGGLI